MKTLPPAKQGRAAGQAFVVVDSESSKLAALKLRCAELEVVIKAKNKKGYLDYGASTCIVTL